MPKPPMMQQQDCMLFVVGCGRSGTTLLYELLDDEAMMVEPCVKLDEPRELYLSFWSESFDIWSSSSKDRGGRLVPALGQE